MPLTLEIATHVYLAILTDTGSFHHSNITPRTFDICRAGGRSRREPRGHGAAGVRQQQLRQTEVDRRAARRDGSPRRGTARGAVSQRRHPQRAPARTYNDTEGLINLPLTAREIQAVVFFKAGADGDIRVSLRSKYDVDVRAVASRHGGGGHKNAAGFTVKGPLEAVIDGILQEIVTAIELGIETRPE